MDDDVGNNLRCARLGLILNKGVKRCDEREEGGLLHLQLFKMRDLHHQKKCDRLHLQ